ncbi:MAG: protein export protein, partial [Dehalococcoidales bacterium]
MVKKKAEKPRREVTKRQLSRWQLQKRRQRILLGLGILVISAVLIVISVGVYQRWYIAEYKP